MGWGGGGFGVWWRGGLGVGWCGGVGVWGCWGVGARRQGCVLWWCFEAGHTGWYCEVLHPLMRPRPGDRADLHAFVAADADADLRPVVACVCGGVRAGCGPAGVVVQCVKEALHERERLGVPQALREREAVCVCVCVCVGGVERCTAASSPHEPAAARV